MNKLNFIRICSIVCLISGGITLLMLLLTIGESPLLSKSTQSALFIICLIFDAVGIILFIASFITGMPSREFRKRLKYARSLPYCEIEDYVAELEIIRANFSADNNKRSNEFYVPDYDTFKPLRDFKVFENGKIYYGALVQANVELFKKTSLERVFPAVILYSEDDFYEKNPEQLCEIAKKLFADKENNVLKNETDYKYHLPVDESLTDGRKVYMSTLLINSRQFPLNCLSGSLFPIIAAPASSTSVFVVDSKYWSDKLMGNFLHGNNVAKRVEAYSKKFSNIGYCEIESYRKERDFIWDRLIEEKAVENLCERGKEELFGGIDGNPDPKVCFGYVIGADRGWQSCKKMNRAYLPVLIVYGTDLDYVDNPSLLVSAAKNWFACVNKKEFFEKLNNKRVAVKLGEEFTDGRIVYAVPIIVSRLWLPEGKLTSNILPVVADTNAPYEVNFIPAFYWSDKFIGNFKGK